MVLKKILVSLALSALVFPVQAASEADFRALHGLALDCPSPVHHGTENLIECRIKAALIAYYGSPEAYRAAATVRAPTHPPQVGPDPGNHSSGNPVDRGA